MKNADVAQLLMAYYERQMQLKGYALQLTDLLRMASCQVGGENYEYMKMSNNRADNEFEQGKEAKLFLQPFSERFSAQYRILYNVCSSDVNSLEKQIFELYDKQKRERADKMAELGRLKKEEENRKKQEAESYVREGDAFKQNRQYEQALNMYQKALQINNAFDIKSKIDDCKNLLRQPKLDVEDLISSGKTTSINAYINPIQKWLKENNRDLSNDEKLQILEHVLDAYNKLNKSSKKNWKKSLKILKELLGMDISGQFKD